MLSAWFIDLLRLSSSRASRHIGHQPDAREDDQRVCSASSHEILVLVRSSWSVLCHVFFGRPLLRLPSEPTLMLQYLSVFLNQFSAGLLRFVNVVPICDVQDLAQASAASLMKNIQLLYNLCCYFPLFTGVYSNRHHNCFI